jgi:hypothetical protein
VPRVCIIETQHPAPGTLERRLAEVDGFAVRTVAAVPDQLDLADVLVLNSIPSAKGSIPEDQILRFIDGGGSVFAIHDSVYPYAYNKDFIAACGIRAAYGAMQMVAELGRTFVQVNLAAPVPGDPLSRFPIDPMPAGAGHPILEGVETFELAEEVWAQNLAPGTRPLLSADVGDRVFAPQRFREGPIPVAACRTLGAGRLAWFSLGHFAAMYDDPNFLKVAANAVRWLAKETNERTFEYDLFLSFSSTNRDEARAIEKRAEVMGLRVFLDEKAIEPGTIWEKVIRQGLLDSRELAVLATPQSIVSEWVMTEWGAAWVLGRTITPIILRLDPRDLPDRLKQWQWIDYHRFEQFLQALQGSR